MLRGGIKKKEGERLSAKRTSLVIQVPVCSTRHGRNAGVDDCHQSDVNLANERWDGKS